MQTDRLSYREPHETTPETWQDRFEQVLHAEPFSPQALIDILKETYRSEYESFAVHSGGNDYSLEEHTLMVMKQFEKYFAMTDDPPVSRELMRTLLALHDIGKPEAIRQGDKYLQHEFTVKILDEILPRLGFETDDIILAKAIIGGDPIGSYLQYGDLDNTVGDISQMAKDANLHPSRMLDTLMAYYMSDASSYTTDAGGSQASSLNSVFDFDHSDAARQLRFSSHAAKRIEQLRATLEHLDADATERTLDLPKIDPTKLTKFAEAEGTNPGGWYEDSESGQKFYIKLYRSPDQARVEWLANEIYHLANIPAVRSQFVDIEGTLGLASAALPEAQPTTGDEQQKNADVKDGFVVDAYLANWDVVGLVHDNVLRAGDGHFYRVDNGGSLVYRAQGGIKSYAPDQIPELQSMRNPNFPAGRVFGDLTETDFQRQARQFLERVDETSLRQAVDDSGIEGEKKETILRGLIGRRAVLLEKYGSQ